VKAWGRSRWVGAGRKAANGGGMAVQSGPRLNDDCDSKMTTARLTNLIISALQVKRSTLLRWRNGPELHAPEKSSPLAVYSQRPLWVSHRNVKKWNRVVVARICPVSWTQCASYAIAGLAIVTAFSHTIF